MPALEQSVIEDVESRLVAYLKKDGNYGAPKYIAAGGSAAIFRVEGPDGLRAFKVFSPIFFSGKNGDADRRRLDVQRRLIGHACSSLVQTYRVEEAEGTAFMEMEFVDWPQLTTQLPLVPDAAVVSLITQLVEAVRFLEGKGIVHRDIKPENIHISDDFTQLKLLDLGVARNIDVLESDSDAPESGFDAATDLGNQRPFLATAQYSSPEYLFRLDEPSSKLWQALNFYQVGAVLHDLIMKYPLFHHEMALGNRWLVARAVLTKTPSFADGAPDRLSNLKALAARCLVKDFETRLQLVGWEDFVLEGASDPLTALAARLSKGHINAGDHARAAADGRLKFDRDGLVKRFIDRVRNDLIPVCGKQLPLNVKILNNDSPTAVQFLLSAPNGVGINCELHIDWMDEPYARTARIGLTAQLLCSSIIQAVPVPSMSAICVITILEGEDEAATNVVHSIARNVHEALNIIDITDDCKKLHGKDLQNKE